MSYYKIIIMDTRQSEESKEKEKGKKKEEQKREGKDGQKDPEQNTQTRHTHKLKQEEQSADPINRGGKCRKAPNPKGSVTPP